MPVVEGSAMSHTEELCAAAVIVALIVLVLVS